MAHTTFHGYTPDIDNMQCNTDSRLRKGWQLHTAKLHIESSSGQTFLKNVRYIENNNTECVKQNNT